MMQLIGRDVVLEEVLRLAADHRLVTLTGVGGIGKTRLGLEAAQRLRVLFSDDVGFVELSSLAISLQPSTSSTGRYRNRLSSHTRIRKLTTSSTKVVQSKSTVRLRRRAT